MLRTLAIFFLLTVPVLCFSQRVKYKSDVEPIIKGPKSLAHIQVLERYYQQSLGKDGKPTSESINYLRGKITLVCLYAGRSYENFAYQNKDYPQTDTAIASLETAEMWYKRLTEDYFVKNDTLKAHIAKLPAIQAKWKEDEQAIIKNIVKEKETLRSNLERLIAYNEDKAIELSGKYSGLIYFAEYKQANRELSTLLNNLEYEKNLAEKKQQAALERKAELQKQMKHEKEQRAFLLLQEKCQSENPCPNCPIEVAKRFRDAYHEGDVMKMKQYIVDYYGDEKLFYNNEFNIFKEFTDEELQKAKLNFRAKTADYKKVNPTNVVFYTDNEEKDFFIDKNYKSYFLHATVFKAINDYDKIDLIKYNGKWKVYRVGGAYGGRSGKTIINGKFFFDPKFLQKEVKKKKKK